MSISLSRRAVLGLRRYAAIGSECLANARIHCEVCFEACDHGAIRFVRTGSVKRPLVAPAACTACGACVSVCPVAAIRVPDAAESAT